MKVDFDEKIFLMKVVLMNLYSTDHHLCHIGVPLLHTGNAIGPRALSTSSTGESGFHCWRRVCCDEVAMACRRRGRKAVNDMPSRISRAEHWCT